MPDHDQQPSARGVADVGIGQPAGRGEHAHRRRSRGCTRQHRERHHPAAPEQRRGGGDRAGDRERQRRQRRAQRRRGPAPTAEAGEQRELVPRNRRQAAQHFAGRAVERRPDDQDRRGPLRRIDRQHQQRPLEPELAERVRRPRAPAPAGADVAAPAPLADPQPGRDRPQQVSDRQPGDPRLDHAGLIPRRPGRGNAGASTRPRSRTHPAAAAAGSAGTRSAALRARS